jgi:hypothetical protein
MGGRVARSFALAWLPEAQTVQYDDPAFNSADIWSHYLYNIVLWAPGSPPGVGSWNLTVGRRKMICSGAI